MSVWKRRTNKRHVRKPPKKRSIKLRRAILSALDLPEETESYVPKLTMVGKSDLLVENHKGVLQYDSKQVRLVVYEGAICVQGDMLELLQMSDTRAYVKGRISAITWIE